MSQQQKKNGIKAMRWFGFIIVLIVLWIEKAIITPENGRGPILGFSYLASIGIVIGATITFYFEYKDKKMKNK
ncbi:hypothetical protein [Paraliobacillus sediminis]|uniref:hypothetical protein n=1 Tax=Paraliobacillus sediminis TaxID=1885916 RepID=UPI000E3C92AD|nr:hypothetical protein [Paraliobacillus sediminis]